MKKRMIAPELAFKDPLSEILERTRQEKKQDLFKSMV
jgi:hypothetical protein